MASHVKSEEAETLNDDSTLRKVILALLLCISSAIASLAVLQFGGNIDMTIMTVTDITWDGHSERVQ